jgi:hypothetical protein
VLVVVVVDVSRVVEEDEDEDEDVEDEVDDEVDDEDEDDDEDDVLVVDVVTGGMQQLFASQVQLSFETYLSLQSCEFWHIIVTFEQFPPTCGQV